jgi:hypothetical protein
MAMGIPPIGPEGPELNKKLTEELQHDAEERARLEHIADEIHPPWWLRIRRSLRARRSSPPPAG